MSDQKHSYKLHYFDIRGRGEPIRLIFEYYGVKYDDNRISMEDWPNLKENAPMGQLPYLEVDDGKLNICQTLAICRYLAKSLKANDYFGGATKSDAAKCDMYAETFMDFFTLGVERIFEHDPDIKAKKDEKFESQYPVRLKILEEHLKKNGGENFVGKKVLWCDLVAVAVLSMVEETKAELLQDFPDLRNYYTNMRNLPEIKDYVAQSWPPATEQ
ncbi:hypothetical protein Y032_0007g3396 [Ancylostoma ceylanicum]|uniref:Glutathione S-transferase protein n=2 Tax=Ancylostoma ceylanicum TaxID=53326 RepID=A0A016VPQ6_9BILA|nr:hypothetical protein Y032_0007g3396 [Ancylostoma ceylanicum]